MTSIDPLLPRTRVASLSMEIAPGPAAEKVGVRRDADHAGDLYDKLEGTVLPLYLHDRSSWLSMMKEAISKIATRFNSQ